MSAPLIFPQIYTKDDAIVIQEKENKRKAKRRKNNNNKNNKENTNKDSNTNTTNNNNKRNTEIDLLSEPESFEMNTKSPSEEKEKGNTLQSKKGHMEHIEPLSDAFIQRVQKEQNEIIDLDATTTPKRIKAEEPSKNAPGFFERIVLDEEEDNEESSEIEEIEEDSDEDEIEDASEARKRKRRRKKRNIDLPVHEREGNGFDFSNEQLTPEQQRFIRLWRKLLKIEHLSMEMYFSFL